MGLIVISGNIWSILKRCRGLFKIKYIWWEGLFAKRKTGRAFLGKMVIKGGGSLVNRGKAGVFGQKALLLPLPTQNRGEGGALGAGVDPGALGMVAAGDEGKRERGLRGFDSPSYLGWGGVWREGHEDRRWRR